MKHCGWMVVGLCASLMGGCDGRAAEVDAGSTPMVDSGTGPAPMADAGTTPPPTVDAGSTPTPTADAGTVPPPSSGTVQGNVTRSGTPANGGRGGLYVAVLTADPVINRDSAMLVGNALIPNVDMSSASTSIPYTITGIPPRAEPYFVTAFLDDNNNASTTDPAAAGPDRGDLVSLESFMTPQVTVPDSTPVNRNLDLNFNLPF